MGTIFRIVIDAEVMRRFVRHIGGVGEQHDLVESKSLFDEVLDLLVVDAWRVGCGGGIEEFDFFRSLLAGAIEQTGEAVLERHSNAFGKGIPDQENSPMSRLQRHLADRSVLEAEAVRDEPVANLAPDVIAVEIGSKTVVVNRVGNPCTPRVLAGSQRRIDKIEQQQQRKAINDHAGIDEGPPKREMPAQSSEPGRAKRAAARHVANSGQFLNFRLSETVCKA